MDEAAIITAVQAGDSNAYEPLVARYHIGLIIHCERLVGDRQTAEDIAQEAFMNAYQHLDHFDATRAHFSTWLYKIATNKAIDYLRSQKHTIPHDDIDELADDEADYASEEELAAVRDAVSRLRPPTHRQAIEAYYWHGKSYQQIADAQQVPIGTVRAWLHRAKQQLKEELS